MLAMRILILLKRIHRNIGSSYLKLSILAPEMLENRV